MFAPITIISTMFVLGLGLSAAAALVSLPRMAVQETEIVAERHKVAVNVNIASDLQRMLHDTTSTVVTMKDLLTQAEAALSDAQNRASVQELKILAMTKAIDMLKANIAAREAERVSEPHPN